VGRALFDKGEVDEAIAWYKKAIALDPKYAQAHNDLGVALWNKGQWAEAIACCQKAIELDPKLAMAHFNLGIALADKGQLDKAIASYRRSLAADGKHPSNASSMAPIHRIKIAWDSPQAGKEPYDSMYPIGEIAYRARGGKAVDTGLPGRATISGGRVDIRLGMDSEDNLYILSKVDGTIREVVGATVSQ